MTLPLTCASTGNFLTMLFHGSSVSCFIVKASLPVLSSIPITLTLILSPSLNSAFISSTFSQLTSEMCTNPSSQTASPASLTCGTLTNKPKGTTPATSASYTSPGLTKPHSFFLISASSASVTAFSDTINLFVSRSASITTTFIVFPTNPSIFPPYPLPTWLPGRNPTIPSISTNSPPLFASLTRTSIVSPVSTFSIKSSPLWPAAALLKDTSM